MTDQVLDKVPTFFEGEWKRVRLQPMGADINLCVSDVVNQQDPSQSGWWVRVTPTSPMYFYSVEDVRAADCGEAGLLRHGDVWPTRTRIAEVQHEPLDLTLAPEPDAPGRSTGGRSLRGLQVAR